MKDAMFTESIKRPALLLRLLVFTLALMSCLLSPSVSTAADPYTIDVNLSLTGPAAFVGKTEAEAIKLYEQVANKQGGIRGQQVRFDIHDDQSVSATAVQIANTLLATHPAVVLGCTLSQNCNAIAPLFVNGAVPYAFSAGLYPKPHGYVFASGFSSDHGIGAMFRYLVGHGITKIGIMASTDTSAQGNEFWAETALKLPEFKNVQVVATEHFNPTDLSVDAQASRIIEACRIDAGESEEPILAQTLASGNFRLIPTWSAVAPTYVFAVWVTTRDWADKHRPNGRIFVGFTPAISPESAKSIRAVMRGWRIHLRSDLSLEEIARKVNPVIRGWINYYGSYYRSALYRVFDHLETSLSRWTMKKYRTFKLHRTRAREWLLRVKQRQPHLFAHWAMLPVVAG